MQQAKPWPKPQFKSKPEAAVYTSDESEEPPHYASGAKNLRMETPVMMSGEPQIDASNRSSREPVLGQWSYLSQPGQAFAPIEP